MLFQSHHPTLRALFLSVLMGSTLVLAPVPFLKLPIHHSKRFTPTHLNRSKKPITYNPQDQTTFTSSQTQPTGALLIDPQPTLMPIIPPTLITTGLLTAPTGKLMPISGQTSQGASLIGLPLNLTISIPTSTLSISVPTSIPFIIPNSLPTTTTYETSSALYSSSSFFAQSTVIEVITVDLPEPTASVEDQTTLEPSTSTTIVYATAPPNIQRPEPLASANISLGSHSSITSKLYILFTLILMTVLMTV